MKFRTKGFIKTFCYRDLFIPGFTIKVKVYGPSLRSADYRRPNLDKSDCVVKNLLVCNGTDKCINYVSKRTPRKNNLTLVV